MCVCVLTLRSCMGSSLGPDPPCPPHLHCYSAMLSRSQWDALYQVPVQATSAPETVITPGFVTELRVPVCWGSRASSPSQLCPAHPCSGLTSVLRVLFPPSLGRQAGPGLAKCPSSGWSHAFLPGSSRALWELSTYH